MNTLLFSIRHRMLECLLIYIKPPIPTFPEIIWGEKNIENGQHLINRGHTGIVCVFFLIPCEKLQLGSLRQNSARCMLATDPLELWYVSEF